MRNATTVTVITAVTSIATTAIVTTVATIVAIIMAAIIIGAAVPSGAIIIAYGSAANWLQGGAASPRLLQRLHAYRQDAAS